MTKYVNKSEDMIMRKLIHTSAIFVVMLSFASSVLAENIVSRSEKRKEEINKLQKRFEWWPTDAKPGAVMDQETGGYWWWPKEPGQVRPWGNRGYVYVFKIIFDYKEDRLPPAKPNELRASLLIRKVVKNIKIHFDYDKAILRDDANQILDRAVRTLKKNPELSILVTGNADIRGTEKYNKELAQQRGDALKAFMLRKGISEDRIRVVSRGKLDAVAKVTDLVGMQKDRNAQFMLAEVQEVMLPSNQMPKKRIQRLEKGKFLIEEQERVESPVRVSTREYVVQDGDTLSKIAHEQLGSGHRWMYLYEINKDRIKNPDKLIPGVRITIPVE